MAAECILIGQSSQFNTFAHTQTYKQWFKQKMFIMHIAPARFLIACLKCQAAVNLSVASRALTQAEILVNHQLFENLKQCILHSSKKWRSILFFLSCVKWRALSPPSGCRLPGKAWPAERGRGQEEVLADPVGGGVLSQPQHRPQGPQGGESAVGRTHEHQDCRYCSNVVLRDTSPHLFKMSFWKRWVLVSWLPWSLLLSAIQKCLNYLQRPFAQCWEVVRRLFAR